MKIYPAKCVAKVVTATMEDGKPWVFTTAKILGAGIGASSGWLIADGENFVYIPSAYEDLEKTLDLLSSLLQSLITNAPTLFAGLASPGPGNAVLVADATAALTQVKTLMEMLK